MSPTYQVWRKARTTTFRHTRTCPCLCRWEQPVLTSSQPEYQGQRFYLVVKLQKFQAAFKGTVSRDFLLLVFFLNQFPPSLWLYCFENSRRYSQLKVCHRCQRHRWQMEKTFKQKNFNNIVWTPLGSRVNIYITFFSLKFTLRCLQPDIVAIICHRYQQR